MVIWLWNNWAIVSCHVYPRQEGSSCRDVLSSRERRETSCKLRYFISDLEKTEGFVRQLVSFDGELWTEARCRSSRLLRCLFLWMGKGARNEPEVKFTRRWKTDYLEQHREPARIIDGEPDSVHIPRTFWCKKNERDRARDRWVDTTRSRRRSGKTFLQKPAVLIEFYSMGIMNEIPISSKEPKGGKAQCVCETRKEMQVTPRGSSLDISCTWVQVRKRLGFFEKYSDDPEGKWDKLAKQVAEVVSCSEASNLEEDLSISRGGELKRGGANVHFNADDWSVKMMLNLISPADDFLYCFRKMWLSWKGLLRSSLKVDEIRLRLFLTPRVLEKATQSSTSDFM